jgi:cyanophycinase
MNRIHFLFTCVIGLLLLACDSSDAPPEADQPESEVEAETHDDGSLFIIGGGKRTPGLLQSMLESAHLSAEDYVVVLPMASSEPDTSFFYFHQGLDSLTENDILNYNLSLADVLNEERLDSLRNSKLIFVTGGDQSIFMNVVKDNPIAQAIQGAHEQGAMIAGTSAGAAIMSEVMITGDQVYTEEYRSTYDKVWRENGVYAKGMGFLSSAIIDQHFIARSRYNRILSALADHPGKMGIGIEESTAILVRGNGVTVMGENQVVVFQAPDSVRYQFLKVGMDNIRMDILLPGDHFNLK